MPRPPIELYIIESPAPDDLYAGRYEGRVLLETLHIAGIWPKYHLTVNFEKFLDAFLEVHAERLSKNDGHLPVIHLSAHGDEKGIGLTDGTPISWNLLSFMLEKVTDGNVIVSMSACFGFSGCRMAMKAGKLPFVGIVGHRANVGWHDAAIGYAAFYHRIYKWSHIDDAVEAMCAASGDDGFVFISGRNAQLVWEEALPAPPPTEESEQIEREIVEAAERDSDEARAEDTPPT